jgi:hypothetical protein
MSEAFTYPLKYGDAVIHGDIADEVRYRTLVLGISLKGAKTKPGEWQNSKITVEDLIDLLAIHEEGAKDGKCLLQGEVIDGERKAQSMRACSILMLDLDTGEDLPAMLDKIKSLGSFAIVWTTHSHLKPSTSIRKDAVVRFIKEKREPTLEDACRYLREVKRYQPHILDQATLGPPEHTKEGIQLVVNHAAMPKFRILFVLEKPFVFADYLDNRAANEAWKAKYEAVSDALGAFHDKACCDPSRLMYTPRHGKDATGYEIHVIAGAALDLDNLPKKPASVWEDIAARDSAVIPKEQVQRTEYKTPWLSAWMGKNATLFGAEQFFHAYGEPRNLRNPVGHHFRCPNDDQHTNAGDSQDNGFYAVDAGSGDFAETYIAHCRHDACQDLKIGNFLDLMIVEHGLSEDDLNQFCDEGLREAEPGIPSLPARSSAKVGGVGEDDTSDEESESSLEGDEFTTPDVYDEKEPKIAHVLRVLKAMNEEWAIVSIKANLRIIQQPLRAGDEPEFRTLETWRGLLAPKKINVPNGDGWKAERVSKLWFEWPKRLTFSRGVTFAPGVVDPKKIPGQYNLWTGWPVEPNPNASCDLFDAHIFKNLCKGDQEQYDFVIMWCADLYQNPGSKKGSALVLRGGKGVGKSIFGKYMLEALGRYGVSLTSKKQVAGDFNAIQESKVLVVCEEAFFSGDHEANNALKNMITSDKIVIERKGIDAYETANHARYLIISNEETVVQATLDERRYLGLVCGDEHQKDEPYFKAICDQMDNGGLGAWVHKLQTYQPPEGRSWSWLRNPPMTEGLRDQIALNMTPEDEWFINAIRKGKIAGFGNAGIEFEEDADTFVETEKLLAAWEMALSPQGHDKKRATGAHVVKMARKYWVVLGDGRKGDGGVRRRGFWVGPLRDCREKLAKMGVEEMEDELPNQASV